MFTHPLANLQQRYGGTVSRKCLTAPQGIRETTNVSRHFILFFFYFFYRIHIIPEFGIGGCFC